MEAHGTDLTGIAAVTAVAVLAGLLLRRAGQPSVVGYILAGIILGPTGLGLVRQTENVATLAELGVVMLLFLIGMELSLKAFVRVVRPAALVVIGQIAASLAIAFGFGAFAGWSVEQSLLIGFVIALSSTAVAMTVLDSIGELRSDIGRITIGVMIAQDIAVVPILVFAESMGGTTIDPSMVAIKIALAIVGLAGLIIWLSRRGKIAVTHDDQIAGKIDLLTLWVLALCFSAAALSGWLGLSPAYGAFCAGLLVASTNIRSEAITVTEPIQSVLLVVFFLSVGLLIDIDYVWANLGNVVAFTIVVLVVKSAFNILLLRLVGEPLERALPAGLIMAQIGEFSFILVAIGLKNGVLDLDGQRLAIAIIAASLLISPLWANAVQRFHAMTFRRIRTLREAIAEAYAEELNEVERGTEVVSDAAKGVRHRVRRTRRVVAIARRRRQIAAQSEAEPAEKPEDGVEDSAEAPQIAEPESTPADGKDATDGPAPAKPPGAV